MEVKDIGYLEFLNEVLIISSDINSIQKNKNKIIIENYDLNFFKYKLDKKIEALKKALID